MTQQNSDKVHALTEQMLAWMTKAQQDKLVVESGLSVLKRFAEAGETIQASTAHHVINAAVTIMEDLIKEAEIIVKGVETLATYEKEGWEKSQCISAVILPPSANRELPWKRYRFHTKKSDPTDFNPRYPYATVGTSEEYTTIVMYLPSNKSIWQYWSDALVIEAEEVEAIKFTDWFPKPDWYTPTL